MKHGNQAANGNSAIGAQSGSLPVFLNSARELAARLARDGSPAAQSMVMEALALADAFRRWEIERPHNDVRIGTIKRLMDLNRRAMDYLTEAQTGRR
jgi:hypothetical protein